MCPEKAMAEIPSNKVMGSLPRRAIASTTKGMLFCFAMVAMASRSIMAPVSLLTAARTIRSVSGRSAA